MGPTRMVFPSCSMGGFALSCSIFSSASVPRARIWPRTITWPGSPARTLMSPEPVWTLSLTGPVTVKVRSKEPSALNGPRAQAVPVNSTSPARSAAAENHEIRRMCFMFSSYS